MDSIINRLTETQDLKELLLLRETILDQAELYGKIWRENDNASPNSKALRECQTRNFLLRILETRAVAVAAGSDPTELVKNETTP